MNRLLKYLLPQAAAIMLLGIGCHRPSTPNEQFQAGVACFKEQKYARSADYFEKVVAALPGNAQARNFLAVCQLHEGKIDEAVKNLQEALRLDADYTAARYNLGLAFLEQGKPADAITALRQVAATPAPPKDVQYQLGLAYTRDSAWMQADQAFTKQLQTGPETVDALNSLGVVCVHQHDYKRAASCFEQAVALYPKSAPSYLNLAIVEQQNLGDKSKALMHYQRYLDLAPRSQQRAEVGKVVTRLSQELAPPKHTTAMVEKPPVSASNIATTTTARAVTRVPTTTVVTRVTSPTPAITTPVPSKPVIVTNYSSSAPIAPKPVVVIVKKKRTPVAVRFLSDGNRAKAAVYFNDGVKLHQQHNLSGAIAAYAKAIAADPSFAAAYYNSAIAYRELGQVSRALDNYELALIADPAYTDARRNYAILLEHQGYTDDAIEQYETILRINQADAAAHAAVAGLYSRDHATLGKARQHYEAYLRLAPDTRLAPEVRRWLGQAQ